MSLNFAFLHGGGQGSWVWSGLVSALSMQAPSANALLLDAPGCGAKRGRNTDDMPFEAIVDDLVADIENSGMRDLVLVGHSQAGTVLPLLAGRCPALIKRLIYVSCSSPPHGVTVRELIGTKLHGASETEVGWPIDPAASSPDERYRIMFCNDMAPTEAETFLAKLHQDAWPMSAYAYRDWRYDHLGALPASYVLLLQDRILPPAWQERFAERFHAGRIVRIDAGHQAMVTRPHALAEALIAEAGLA